jgi:NAD(P) transhydrogenase
MSLGTRSYDLVVIGGGPAGIWGATTAAVLGKTVALVDSHHELGGAGVNTGTVPSKTLRETALALSGIKARDLFGVDLALRREATVGEFLRHEQKVKSGLNALVARRLDAYRADVFYGSGVFVDPHTIRVSDNAAQGVSDDRRDTPTDVLLRGERILIATGSSPVRPPIFPFGPGVYDSDTILKLDRLPKTMAVIGAGVIGSEYASTFAALGAQVHLIHGQETLLPFLDGEVARALVSQMQSNGILFHWNERAEACTVDSATSANASGKVTLALRSGGALTVDAVLVAAGRKSNVEQLNLPAAGVGVAERGLIHVDENFATNIPHIYAAGDVIGFPALASTSMEQARRAVGHALGGGVHSPFPQVLPTGIYTIPEIGMVGETEENLNRDNVDYVVGRASYRDSGRGQIIGDPNGFLKLLFRRDNMQLLGVHVLGEQATDVVHIGLMVLLSQGTADVFDVACFNLPTLGALYKFATFDAMQNRRAGSAATAKRDG